MPDNMREYIELINKNLDKFLKITYPQEIFESMRYSVLAEGKRLRPVMCLESCRIFGGKIEDAIPTACAIEMLHAQSLIHDDLPCMDNDDFRRGKPTNHKAFSEATAVLAGDALLTLAPQIIIQQSENLDAQVKIKLVEQYCIAAGAFGLIAGQIVDIQSEGQKISPKTLEFIHTHKTADLFKLALKAGAIIAKADEKIIKAMDDLGQCLGFAFQICDDILDETSSFEKMGKTLGKDKDAQKSTYTALFGVKKARSEVICLLNKAHDIISKNNIKSGILEEIIKGIQERSNS
ncbi:MAG TPA: polyprenyl synthetase family protein [Candidatus Gastranaerophilaceae bacterium]|nr:polyprenyl synthetase family protein [Candidatus Gastranaerophilaceae bacterium]HPT41456.1 polyprenyl synthetase family protein [Candidatus Gastranaerophilaceae bacterium]